MEVRWQEELMKRASEVMVQGGELRFVVIKRNRERIPEIYSYPDNKVRCETETLTE